MDATGNAQQYQLGAAFVFTMHSNAIMYIVHVIFWSLASLASFLASLQNN